MKTETLVAELEFQREMELDRKEKEWKRKLLAPKPPVSRIDANISRIIQLQDQTNKMRDELAAQQLLAVESRRNQNASMDLYLANLTHAEQEERDEDTRRMQLYASQFCREAGPDWREDATAAFKNRKL